MRALPRTTRAAAAIALAVTGLLVLANPAMAKSKPPVKLDGKVNNKGVGATKKGSVAIEQNDSYFKKTFIKAPAGTVTVELENEGSAQHTFTVDDQNVDIVVAPGATKTVSLTATAASPTAFYCKFHVGQGMQGALFVTAGGTGAKTKSDTKSNTKPNTTSNGPGGYDYGS